MARLLSPPKRGWSTLGLLAIAVLIVIGCKEVSLPTPTTISELAGPVPKPSPTPSAEVRAFVWPEEVMTKAGDLFEIAVWVSPGSTGISAGEINVSFPTEAFEAVDVQAGTLLGREPLVGYKELNNSSGFVRLAMARVGPTDVPSAQGSFSLITLHCKENTPPGQYRIKLDAGLANEQFEEVALASVQGGLVKVQAT